MNVDRLRADGETDFAVMAHLLGGDRARLCNVLGVFRQFVADVLQHLDSALSDGAAGRIVELAELAELAERGAMACYAVGESKGGRLLQELSAMNAYVVVDPVLMERLTRARFALADSISRVDAYMLIESGVADQFKEKYE